MQYRIPGHSVVADGWRITYPGGQTLREYHINYGWGWLGNCDGCDTWYELDEIFGGNPDDEYMLEQIYPDVALGPLLSGVYGLNLPFPYRYFDRDTLGLNATFAAGQHLQSRSEDGQSFVVTVIDISGSSVTLDANHPLAGKDLNFDIKLLEIV